MGYPSIVVWFDFESRDRATLYTVQMYRNHADNSISSNITVYTEKGTFIEVFETQNAQNEDFELVSNGQTAYVNKWFGMRVQHKISGYYCEIWAPSSYMSKVAGLCGTFNDDSTDDFFASNGKTYDPSDSKQEFIESWIVPLSGECDHIEDDHD